MNELVLRYSRDDPPNACGPLDVTVHAHGFSGRCRTYISEVWLVSFAQQVRAFPLPANGVSEELLIDEDTGMTIKVTPKDSLGRLLIDISVREITGDLAQRVDAQLVTDYAAIERFSRELVAAASAGTGEARIAA